MSGEWFELVSGRELQQGDLLVKCPVFVPDMNYPPSDGQEVTLPVYDYDLVVLTQTCDLVENQKRDIRQVLLCAIASLENLRAVTGHKLAGKDGREALRKFNLMGYHPLPAFQFETVSIPFSVVTFSQTYSLPIDYVRQQAISAGSRLRLRSPYREFLAQRFGFFFSRIAIDGELELPK